MADLLISGFFLCVAFPCLVLCPGQSSHPGLPELPAPSFQFRLPGLYLGPLSLHPWNSIQQAGVIIELTSTMASQLSEIIDLHCLLSNALRTIISYILSSFLVISSWWVHSVPATPSWLGQKASVKPTYLKTFMTSNVFLII